MALGWLVALYVIAAGGWILALVVTYVSHERMAKLTQEKKVSSPEPRALVSDKMHGLQNLYPNNLDWHWKCQCGRMGRLSSFDTPKPSEERAILAWRNHVETHERLVLPTNELSHQACDARFVGLWSLFSKYRKACYCQQTNDELILLNQEAKTFEETSEKGIQLESCRDTIKVPTRTKDH